MAAPTPYRLRKAWSVRVKGYDGAWFIHAPTAEVARLQAYNSFTSRFFV